MTEELHRLPTSKDQSKKLATWIDATHSYIDRTTAKLAATPLNRTLELPQSPPEIDPWVPVILRPFTAETAERYELGRVVVFPGDRETIRYAALPVDPRDVRDVFTGAALPDGPRTGTWIRRIGEERVRYSRKSSGQDSRGKKIVDVVITAPSPFGVSDTQSAGPVRASDTQSAAPFQADLHRQAWAVFETHIQAIALELLEERGAPWPQQALDQTLLVYLRSELLRNRKLVVMPAADDQGNHPTAVADRAIDDLRLAGLTTHEAVEVVHADRIASAAESATGTDRRDKRRELVDEYRKRLTKRDAKLIDPFRPGTASDFDVRKFPGQISLVAAIDRSLASLHLYARQRIASALLSDLFRSAYVRARQVQGTLLRRKLTLHGSAGYRAVMAARNDAVRYRALSRHVSPERILTFYPDLVDRLVDGPIDRALEQEVLDTATTLLDLQLSRSQA